MPLKNYGVLKGTPIDKKLGFGSSPHYQVLINDFTDLYRIAVNIKSKAYPSELFYYIDDGFMHPILDKLPDFEYGFTEITQQELSMDYIRGNLFSRDQMKPLPHDVPGPDNDLNEKIDLYIQRAVDDRDAIIYAFGERWGPEPNKRDKYFGFKPGNGIHDIHMNQGSHEQWKKDNGVWQDGGLIIYYPSNNQYVAIFLAFQSQCFHTNDETGNCIDVIPDPVTKTEGSIFIIAALVNSENIGGRETETVILMNLSDESIDLTNWAIADKRKRKEKLEGSIEAHAVKSIKLSGDNAILSNKGGIISLLDANDIKIHGVSYSKTQAKKEGWLIRF